MFADEDTMVVEAPSGGLRASHHAACHAEGMSDLEIEKDWAEVEKALVVLLGGNDARE